MSESDISHDGERFASVRHQQIVDLIRQQGRGDVSAMAEHFGVTPETIRRDFTKLERRGLIRRIHGGAIPVHRLGYEPALAQRLQTMSEEKARIAEAALSEIPTGGSIALDAGSSVGRMVELLTPDTKLIVVTHAHPLAGVLTALPDVTLHMVGGVVRPTTMAAVGPWAERSYAEVHVDVAFLGVNGISVENGLTTPDIAEAAVKRAMVEHAQRVVVLADHTKLGRDEFSRICAIDDVDVVITDAKADPELVDEFRSAGVEVVVTE